MDPATVEAAIRTDNIHFPVHGAYLIENTHNRAGGAVVPFQPGIFGAIGQRYLFRCI